MLSETITNPEIKEILNRYEHYGHMKYDDLKAFRDYRDELRNKIQDKKFNLKHGILTEADYETIETEHEEIEYINQYKIYNSTLTSLYEMNGILQGVWSKTNSGYSNNAFFDFKKLVEYVNAYWQIENPYKAPNKIGYGWKFCMEKGNSNSYYDKGWKLYLWGCIKNYLIKNGVEFTKEESLKVRKIVGLVDVKDTIE